MLIDSPRITDADRAHWERMEQLDAMYARARGDALSSRIDRAVETIARFVAAGDAYLGVSWGKDSVVCAWLVHLLEQRGGPCVPTAWVKLTHWQNPDSWRVRDAFMREFPLRQYDEIVIDRGETVHGNKEERLTAGFREAARRYGDRYISGVRADESTVRRISVATHGEASRRSCRPIARWSCEDVYAVCHRERLPLHPAYACSHGGAIDRSRIRVANIGGVRGQGRGRAEWERVYYPDVWRAEESAGAKP